MIDRYSYSNPLIAGVVIQGGHVLWKTGKLVKRNSLQGKIREFRKRAKNQGKIREFIFFKCFYMAQNN